MGIAVTARPRVQWGEAAGWLLGFFPPRRRFGWVYLPASIHCVFTVLMEGQCAGKFPTWPAAGRTVSTDPLLHPQSPFQCQGGANVSCAAPQPQGRVCSASPQGFSEKQSFDTKINLPLHLCLNNYRGVSHGVSRK